jgi:hypothetical protein
VAKSVAATHLPLGISDFRSVLPIFVSCGHFLFPGRGSPVSLGVCFSSSFGGAARTSLGLLCPGSLLVILPVLPSARCQDLVSSVVLCLAIPLRFSCWVTVPISLSIDSLLGAVPFLCV